MKILAHVIGFALLAAAGYALWLELRGDAPVPTSHLAFYGSFALVGLCLMGFADEIAAGLKSILAVAGSYLPWKKGGDA